MAKWTEWREWTPEEVSEFIRVSTIPTIGIGIVVGVFLVLGSMQSCVLTQDCIEKAGDAAILVQCSELF